MKSLLFTLAAAVALGLGPRVASAQSAPETPLRMIVPYAPGGTTDALARLLQRSLSQIMNRTVIVDNKPGATGTIGTALGAKAPADGNTIIFGNQGPNAIVPAVRKTPYDPINDLRPLTTVAFMPLALVVAPDRGPQTLRAFIEQGRKSGAGFAYGSSGIGGFGHLAGHEFARMGGLDMTHVPFKGGGEVATAIMGGSVQSSFVTALEATPLVTAGRLRFLAVGSPKRMPLLPQVPAVAEELPGFDAVIWFGAFAPKGTPDAIAERLRDAIVKAVQSPEYRQYLEEHNAEARASTPGELTDLIRRDMQVWGDVIKKNNIPL
ncbi:MAG: tripartite tricarboxylate transporter substrate binding protein [Rubrivivax sp.]